jgi:hypothetical protein
MRPRLGRGTLTTGRRIVTMAPEAGPRGVPAAREPRITILPTTPLGRWAGWLAVSFFVFVFAAPLVPRAAALGFVLGFAGGVAALTAIVRERDRAVAVFAALAPLVIGVAFVLAESINATP